MSIRHVPALFFASLLAAGCCNKPGKAQAAEEEDGAKPGAATALPHHAPVTAHKPATRKATVPTAGEATVNAPPFKNGNPRRGIVRSAPNFQAPEVARLNNGTVLNLVRPPLPGGWCEVSWPVNSDANRGFIHSDVLDVTLYGD
jgi:hypothetical protein